MDELYKILVVVGAGTVGGLIHAMCKPHNYEICLPLGRRQPVGCLADLCVGAAASLAVYSIITLLTTIPNDCPGEFAYWGAIGIISGYAGLSILEKLSTQLRNRVASIEGKVVHIETDARVRDEIRIGDMLTKGLDPRGQETDVEAGMEHYDEALRIDPRSVPALIGKARALKHMDQIRGAIDLAKEALEVDPDSHRAWYNLACYQCLDEHPVDEVLSSLAHAVRLYCNYRQEAREESDFESIREDSRFQRLIKQP